MREERKREERLTHVQTRRLDALFPVASFSFLVLYGRSTYRWYLYTQDTQTWKRAWADTGKARISETGVRESLPNLAKSKVLNPVG